MTVTAVHVPMSRMGGRAGSHSSQVPAHLLIKGQTSAFLPSRAMTYLSLLRSVLGV